MPEAIANWANTSANHGCRTDALAMTESPRGGRAGWQSRVSIGIGSQSPRLQETSMPFRAPSSLPAVPGDEPFQLAAPRQDPKAHPLPGRPQDRVEAEVVVHD